MVFVTADIDRTRLESLTKQLVSAFPGSTVYQHINPARAPRDVFNNKISCVFLEAEMDDISGIELMRLIHRQKADIPVFILSSSEELRNEAIDSGAVGYLIYPVSDSELTDAVTAATKAG